MVLKKDSDFRFNALRGSLYMTKVVAHIKKNYTKNKENRKKGLVVVHTLMLQVTLYIGKG